MLVACSMLLDEAHRGVLRGPFERSFQVDAVQRRQMLAFKEVNDKLLEKGIKIPFACGGGAVNQDFVSQYELGVYGEEAADAPKIADAIVAGTKDITALREEFHKH